MSNINSTGQAKKTGGPRRALVPAVEGADAVEAGEIGARGDDGLVPRQRAFVDAFVSGKTAGNGTLSAIAAGYSKKTAPSAAWSLLKLPHVSAAIDAALREEIGVTLTAQAVRVIRTIITDETAPLKLRGDMAAKVIEFSGVVERTKTEKAKQTGLDGSKKLVEYTREELEKLVRDGAAVLHAAAALPPAGQVIEGQIVGDGAANSAAPASQQDQ